MQIRIDVYVHFDSPVLPQVEQLTRQLRDSNDQLQRAVSGLPPGAANADIFSILSTGDRDMSTSSIHQAIENLRAEVERNSTVDDSAITLVSQLAAKVEELKGDPAALQALVDRIRESSDTLAAAVTANTPAEEGSGNPDDGAGTGNPDEIL